MRFGFDYDELKLLQSPHKFSKTPSRIPGLASRLSQHTDELLGGLCGYTAEQIQEFKQRGVLVEHTAPIR